MALIYDTFTLGAPDNFITFNDYTNTTASATFRAEARYTTRRSFSEYDVKLPEVNGIADFQTLVGKQMYIISGEMFPNTPDESGFHIGRRQLRRVADLTEEQADPYSDHGYVPVTYSELIGGVQSPRQIFVKPMYVDLKESTRQGLVQPFTIYCKIKDPVIYGTTTATSSSQTVSTTSVGLHVPFLVPALVGAATGQSSNQIVNIGDLPAYPTISISGPVTNPRITNVATGEYMGVNVSLTSTNDQLVITSTSTVSTITLNGNSVYNLKTDGSIFFKLRPGTINFMLTGTPISATATATVSFLPAWPLS